MQQYIVRREQDFRRLEENATGTSVPEQIRAMMLLCFGGLDPKEQTSILSSCNNTYEFQKIARAMRIQYPNSAGKPVIRRDYLGARSSGQPLQSQHFRAKWRGRLDHKTRQVLAVEDEPDFTPADEDAYYEDDEEYQIADDEEAFQGYSDDELMDALLSEFPDFEEDPHVAEAFATVAQHRFNKKKKFGGRPTPSSSPTTSAGQQLGFTAKGEMSFSEKARDQRRTAVKFLKSVTPCTVCHQKGHWAGDAECPASRKGKGKGKGKPSAKKKPQKVATTLFVSRGHEPEDNLAEETALCAEAEPQECYISESITAPEDNDPAQNSYDPAGFFVPVIESLPDTSYGMFLLAHYTMNSKKVAEVSRVKIDYGNQPVKRRSKVAFSHVCDESEEDEGESLMTLHCPKLCEHSSYTGGSERKYHRGANGHTRHVTCKESECNKTVIVGHRKEAVELWSYFIQILMCTKWGQEARSAGLFRRVGQVRDEYDQEVRRDKALTMAPSAPAAASIARRTTRKTAGPIPDSPYDDGWSLCDGASGGYPSPSSPSSNATSAPRVAKIVRATRQRVWLYGIMIAPDVDLPPLPELASEDMDILQPLPHDEEQINDGGPFQGHYFRDVAESLASEGYCKSVMGHVLRNEPSGPEIFRFAFYLYGRLRLVKASAERMTKPSKEEGEAKGKRSTDPDDMKAVRKILAPLQYDIDDGNTVNVHECEVMMVSPDEESYALSAEDPPGLAILDSGCTRTMHGKSWAEQMEKELVSRGLSSSKRVKNQIFRGIGGKIESKHVRVFPVGIYKVHGEIHSAETPGNTPLLLSRPFMEELGAVINLADQTISFLKVNIHNKPLLKTAKGHLALNLLDFNEEKLDEFVSDDEDQHGTESTTAQHHVPRPPGLAEEASPTEEEIRAFEKEVLVDYDYPRDYGGQNPDDVHDHEDWIASLREDVKEYLDPDGNSHDCHFVCEDESLFASIAKDEYITRKTTNKKWKRICGMEAALQGEDFLHRRAIQGQPHKVPRRPPSGRVWLKQLFAGQMGLTMMAVLLGLTCGVPLDFTANEWDATTSKGRKQLHHDLIQEDPYLLVITHPCGPWGNWSRFNLAKGGTAAVTIEHLRTEGHEVLKTVNKTVKDRVRAQRHVFLEQPLGSQSLEEPEMADVRRLLDEGSLMFIKVDGCVVGYKDSESGLPHKKPSYYVTSLVSAETLFSTCQCDGSHQHEILEGANKFGSRTAQASVWPHQLNEMVITAMLQQREIETTAFRGVHEAFPAEAPSTPASAPQQKRRKPRRGKQAILMDQFAAPPVYIRPQALPELLDEDPDVPEDEDAPPLEDQEYRAHVAAGLDPALSISEAQRRQEWLQVNPELRRVLRVLHVNFGRPTNTTLLRILRRQQARPEALRAAALLSCDSCGESIRRRRPKPVRLPGDYTFNAHLSLDVFYCRDAENKQFSFLNIIDEGTSFQVVTCLGESQGPPASRAVLRHFLTAWSSWAGLPRSIQVDRGREFLAHFADYLKQFGVEQEVMPLEAPWKQGKVEKAGGIWKELMKKVVHESQITGLQDMIIATAIVTQIRNAHPRANGYAPNQWVLGIPEVRIPGSLRIDDDQERLELLEAADNPQSAMARNLALRETARICQIKLDTDSRVRRALLHQSTPTRGPFPIGAYVYFLRQQQGADSRGFKWYGPARVIGVEMRNQKRGQEDEIPTGGGQPHSYWVRYGPSVVLVTGEQLRFASEDELVAAHVVPQSVLEPEYTKGARNYVDLRHHAIPMIEPSPDEQEQLEDEELHEPHQSGPIPLPLPAAAAESPSLPSGIKRAEAIGSTDPISPTRSTRPRTGPSPTDHSSGALPPVPEDDDLEDPVPGHSFTHVPETPPVQSAGQGHGDLQHAMQTPDRLDGHPLPPQPGPVRASRGHTLQGPYYVEDGTPNVFPDLNTAVRNLRLLRMAGDISKDSETEDDEAIDDVSHHNLKNDVLQNDSYLTGAAVRTEVNIFELPPEDRLKFDAAMAKERASWQKFSAVEVLTEEQVEALPGDTKIIGTRWVHVDKNKKPRLLAAAMSKKTKKTKEQIQKEFPFEAKSRIVVQGHQEEETGIRSDSPTASLLAFNLICSISVLQGWPLVACDASTAYLQSKGISRLLILRPPRPPPPGILPTDLLRAKGSIYGTRDAGRSWWKKLFNAVKAQGWKMSSIEQALFYLFVDGSLTGIMASHVDDLFCTGTGEKFFETIKILEKEIHLKVKQDDFRFCGKNVKRIDGRVELDQFDAIESIEYIVLKKERRTTPNAPLTEEEKSEFRGLIGSMGWVTRQTRPDLLVNVSLASQTMGKPTIQNIIDLNKAVKMMKETSEAKYIFNPNERLTWDNVIVCVFADSSFANVEMKSQCGYIIGLTIPEIASGEEVPLLLLETYSGSIKRVCRSTLAAEANAFLMGSEAGDYVRSLILEMKHPELSLSDIEKEMARPLMIAITDAKSLESTITKDAGQPTDKRVKILVSQVKEILGYTNYDDHNEQAIWCDTAQMLADVLTKAGCEREPILQAMATSMWRLRPSEEAFARKMAIRAGRHRRKAVKRSGTDAASKAKEGSEIEKHEKHGR